MNTYPFKVLTSTGDFYSADVRDIPVYISAHTFILALRSKSRCGACSPICTDQQFLLGSDLGVFEGDLLEDADGSLWVVRYQCGFKAQNVETRVSKFLYRFKHIKVVGSYQDSPIPVKLINKHHINYKYDGSIFQLDAILGPYLDNMFIRQIPGIVSPNEIQQDAGLTRGRSRLYFGDTYKGGVVTLKYGRLVVPTNCGLWDIEKLEFINKEDIILC